MNDGGYLRQNIFIGRYCSIGRRVSIGAANHKLTGVTTYPLFLTGSGSPYSEREINYLGLKREREIPTIIGSDVWIGDGAVVLAGSRIGTGAVIGANSVVNRDVPPYAIVLGVPAKIVRFRFPEQIIEQLLISEWWEYSASLLCSMPTNNVFEFLEEIYSLKKSHSHISDFETYKLQD